MGRTQYGSFLGKILLRASNLHYNTICGTCNLAARIHLGMLSMRMRRFSIIALLLVIISRGRSPFETEGCKHVTHWPIRKNSAFVGSAEQSLRYARSPIFQLHQDSPLLMSFMPRYYARHRMHGLRLASNSRVPCKYYAEARTQMSRNRFSPERIRGNVEYKLKLSAEVGSPRFEELVTQLNWRMRECVEEDATCEVEDEDIGQYREAIYRLGVMDDGEVVGLSKHELLESLKTLQAMAERIPAATTVVSKATGILPGNRTAATVLIRALPNSNIKDGNWRELRICTVGNVDSGKSTLMGVLTKGLQDDGKGKARSAILQHRHEMETGRTSSIANMLLGFDESGNVVNYKENAERSFRNEEPEHRAALPEAQARVVERSAKLITFSDLCGHEKYFKTTLVGMVGLDPDYLLCTLDANRGEMRGMVHEHLLVANALAIPTIVCLTKCDMAGDRAQAALKDLKKFLKQMDMPAFVIKDKKDVVVAAERLLQGYTPIISCSAVTGVMISEIKLLLNLLVKRTSMLSRRVPQSEGGDPDLLIMLEDVFPQVPGVGLVVSGRVVQGSVTSGDTVRLGPVVNKGSGTLVKDGFIDVRISSMRFEDVPAKRMSVGTVGTFALKATGKSKALLDADPLLMTARGKVLLGKKSKLLPTRWLKANITILQHPSSIRLGYQPVLHVGMIRQAARVMAMHDAESGLPIKTLRAGDSATILFQWGYRPEVVQEGSALIFRESLVKGIGSVTWVGDLDEGSKSKSGKGSERTISKADSRKPGRTSTRATKQNLSDAGKPSGKTKAKASKKSSIELGKLSKKEAKKASKHHHDKHLKKADSKPAKAEKRSGRRKR